MTAPLVYVGVDVALGKVAAIAIYPDLLSDALVVVPCRFGSEIGVIEVPSNGDPQAVNILLNSQSSHSKPCGLGWTFMPGDEL